MTIKINFDNLSYSTFKMMAKDHNLTKNEKIGFPKIYRDNLDEVIFNDMLKKIPNLNKANQTILDIGCGCGTLIDLLLKHCNKMQSTIHLNDSKEMLSLLPDGSDIIKWNGKFQDNSLMHNTLHHKLDVIICYSVFQYIINDISTKKFINLLKPLLKPGGQVIIGDIPNFSSKLRFLNTKEGKEYYKNVNPSILKNNYKFSKNEKKIDDRLIIKFLSLSKDISFNAWLMPQVPQLPLSNRRDDIIIEKSNY